MWRYLAASVRGTSHIEQTIPCQDSSLVKQFGEILLLVASDGAGSALFSQEGSRIACGAIAEEVADYLHAGNSVSQLTEAVADTWIDSAVKAIHDRASTFGEPVREFACTLLVCLLGPDGSAYLQLGDGGIIGRYFDDYVAITWPSGGEYANTTFFLSDDHALEHFQSIFGAPAADEVAVFTDGLQMLALQFAAAKPHSPFFTPMFDRLRSTKPDMLPALEEALAAYLASDPINRRTDDDKTLILAVRQRDQISAATDLSRGNAIEAQSADAL